MVNEQFTSDHESDELEAAIVAVRSVSIDDELVRRVEQRAIAMVNDDVAVERPRSRNPSTSWTKPPWLKRFALPGAMAASLLFAFAIFGLTKEGRAWAEVVEAVAATKWMRLTWQLPDDLPRDALPKDVAEPHLTIWISGDRTKCAAQNRWESRWDDLTKQETQRFNKKTGRLRFTKTEPFDSAEMRFLTDLLDRLQAPGKIRSRGKLIDSSHKQVTLDGKEYTDFRFLFRYKDTTPTDEELTVRVDRSTNRPIQLLTNRRGVFAIDYPDVGPNDIYALDVPEDTPVDDVRSLAKFFPAKEPQNPADYEAIALEFVVREEPKHLEYLNWAYRYRKVDGVTTNELADPDKVIALAMRAYKAGRLAPKTEEELRWFTDQIRTYAFSPADTTQTNNPEWQCYSAVGSVDSYDSAGKSSVKGFEEALELRGPDRTLWFDPMRGMIVRRIEFVNKEGNPVIEIQDVVEGPNGNWFPTRRASGTVAKRGDDLTPDSLFVYEYDFK